jgi:hypothetical protein
VEFSRNLTRGGSIKKSCFTDSQIIAMLKRAESSTPVPELCRERHQFGHFLQVAQQVPW